MAWNGICCLIWLLCRPFVAKLVIASSIALAGCLALLAASYLLIAASTSCHLMLISFVSRSHFSKLWQAMEEGERGEEEKRNVFFLPPFQCLLLPLVLFVVATCPLRCGKSKWNWVRPTKLPTHRMAWQTIPRCSPELWATEVRVGLPLVLCYAKPLWFFCVYCPWNKKEIKKAPKKQEGIILRRNRTTKRRPNKWKKESHSVGGETRQRSHLRWTECKLL